MNLKKEDKDTLKNELLILKLKKVLTTEEKLRIQTLQQLLFGNQ
jgi:hypothetical protein